MSDDDLSTILNSRRIPHGKSRNSGSSGRKGRSGGGAAAFDPLRAVGAYDVKLGGGSRGGDERFVIHGFTDGEEGLVASFDFEIETGGGGGGGRGRVVGMALLAGSRKGLQGIIDGLEESDDGGEDEDEDEDEIGEEEKGNREGASTRLTDEDAEDESDEDGRRQLSKLELEDARMNRRAKAFEKNSFRNPKFWMRWRAHISNAKSNQDNATTTTMAAVSDLDDDDVTKTATSTGVDEVNMGYIVFSGNDCSSFDGTISSCTLGWDNLKFKGRRIKSKVSGRCPFGWTEFG